MDGRRRAARPPARRQRSHRPNGRDVVVGEYVELDPPHRLVFTWGFDGDGRATGAGSSRVEVVLETDDGDHTRLTLSHHDLPPSRHGPRTSRAGPTTWSASAEPPRATRPAATRGSSPT